jgi:hypothetical protein
MADKATPNVNVMVAYYPPNSTSEKYAQRRAFYTSNTTDYYLRYIDKGTSKNTDYVNYVDDSEKSTGVFNKDGILNKSQKAELRQQLRATQSVISDIVISFKSNFGFALMKNTDDAQALIKSQLNRFLRKAGLNPSNVEWFVGLHENTDNKHIHLCFWEREPMFIQRGKEGKFYHHGKLRQLGIDSFKIGIEEHLTDSANQLKSKRVQLTKTAEEALKQSGNTKYDKELQRLLTSLAYALPDSGHLGYDSDNMQYARKYADEVTRHILTNSPSVKDDYAEFKTSLEERDNYIRDLCLTSKIPNVEDYLKTDIILRDLYRRLGNKAIQAALQIKHANDKKKRTKTANKIAKRIARKDLSDALRNVMYHSAEFDEDALRAFRTYLKQLENDDEFIEEEIEELAQQLGRRGYEM